MVSMPRSIRPLVLLALAGVVATAACANGSGDAEARAQGSFDDAPRFVAEPGLRIGNVDDPDLGFSRVGGVAVAPDGRVFVVEGQDLEVRVFDPEGTLIGRMGRRGEGPGEFGNSPRIGLVGDTLWAYEAFADRLSLFRTDGTLIHTRRMEIETIPIGNGIGTIMPAGVDGAGRLVGALSGVRYQPDAETSDARPDSVPRWAYDWEGAPVEIVGWDPGISPRISPPPGYESDFRNVEVDGRRYSVPPPPSSLPLWSQTGDGVFILEAPTAVAADRGRFTVTHVSVRLDTIYRSEFDYTPEPWTSDALDAIAESRAKSGSAFVLNGPQPDAPDNWERIAARLREEMRFPEFRSPVDWLYPTEDGRVWVRASISPEPGTRRWLRLSTDGRIEGDLLLPESAQPRWSDGDDLWVSESDEFGIPWLVWYRLSLE